MRQASEIVIAGAGIAGIATAWQIGERLGTTTAILVDPRPPLTLTSDRPGANHRDWWPHPAMVRLAQRSLDLATDLRAAGSDFAIDRRGYLFVTADASTADALPDLVTRHLDAGVAPDDVELLSDRSRIADRFPHLDPAISAAIVARRAGSLDTVGLGRAMLAVAEAHGVQVMRGTVTGVDVAGGRVRGVTVSATDGDRTIATDRLVDAAGPFARSVAALAGLDLPLETVLRQKVVIRDRLGVVPRDAPFTIGLDRTDGLPAGVHIKPDASAGPEAIKLGWARDQTPLEPEVDPTCPVGFPVEVLDRASTIVPGLGAYLERMPEILAHDGGFYARTQDGLPLIGPLDVDGMFVVAGFAGFGSMMAAAAGELAAGWVLGGAGTDLSRSFDPRRSSAAADGVSRAPGVAPPGEL